MQRFKHPSRTIHVQEGEEFAIALASNPTTGYTWQADADEDYLELLGQELEGHGQSVGAGGEEAFTFRCLAQGKTEITFNYLRPWEPAVRDTKRFRVVIE
jgi:inhibitor of cysteine peptidase